jgi:hypothetical protein
MALRFTIPPQYSLSSRYARERLENVFSLFSFHNLRQSVVLHLIDLLYETSNGAEELLKYGTFKESLKVRFHRLPFDAQSCARFILFAET